MKKIRKQLTKEIDQQLRKYLPSRGEFLQEVIDFAVNDVFETSALTEGEDYWTHGGVALARERTILHAFEETFRRDQDD